MPVQTPATGEAGDEDGDEDVGDVVGTVAAPHSSRFPLESFSVGFSSGLTPLSLYKPRAEDWAYSTMNSFSS